MSSSEPRLPYGDGMPEVCAAPVVRPSDPRVPLGPKNPMPASSKKTPSISGPVMAESFSPASSVTSKRTNDDPDRLPLLLSFSDLLLEAPAWLFSAALHMMAVILLGLLFIVPEHSIELLLRLDDNDGFEELSGSEFDLALDLAEEAIETSFEPQELTTLEEPILIEPTEIQPLDSESILVASPIQMALSGRSEGMQQKLLDAYGGTAATQRAVQEALRWLYRYQGKQGMWSLTGRYKNGARAENEEAATGLALLAFQGAGYTPNGPQHDYTRATARAWSTLLQRQEEDGNFFRTGAGNGQLYTQAICTIALCELYGMTRSSQYREPAQRAIDYCVKIQSSKGGWRYYPGTDSDLSVTGWFVMAMQSARMAGLEVPSPTLKRISGFLDSVSHESGSFYGYQPRSAATASMTAEGLLCRQYLGWSQSDSRLRIGAKYLIRNLPSWEDDRDVYYWYYATQVCHHMEGKYWRTWNDTMKVVLPANQVEKGPERGSWNPKGDEWGNEGGRLFVTCLSTYMLEVYYRHLPIYQTNLLGH